MAQTLFTPLVTLIQSTWLNDVDANAFSALSAVAGTNTITATGPTTVTAYAANQRFFFTPANNNTGATTLNISSIGAKSVFWNGVACVGGELRQGIPALVLYDGTQFQILANGFNAPFLDTHAIVVGSADSTKKVRFEVDGLTTGTTRVATVPDRDFSFDSGWSLIEAKPASASATIDFVTGITSTYDEYVITITDYVPATNATQLSVRISQDGGATFKAGATDYKFSRNALGDAGVNTPAGSTGATSILPTPTLSSTAANSLSGWIKFSGPSGATSYKKFRCEFTAIDSAGASDFITAGGAYVTDTNAINGVRILSSSGNIASGNFALYGLRKS